MIKIIRIATNYLPCLKKLKLYESLNVVIKFIEYFLVFFQFQEIFLQYSFGEVLSTRRYRSDSNQNYLDMKLGNLMAQKIVRIETEQGSDISILIGQYMQVINRHRKRPLDRGVASMEQSY